MRGSGLCNKIAEKLKGVETILDIGCGEGDLVTCLAKKMNKKMVGLDVSHSGFTKAKRKAKRAGAPTLVSCVKGDAHNVSEIFDERFEAVLLTYTLHHLDEPDLVLKEIHRVMEPKGKILVTDLVLQKGKRKDGCYKYTTNELYELVANAGFKNLDIERINEDSVIVIGVSEGDSNGSG